MKKLQLFRLLSQVLYLIFTVIVFLIDLKWFIVTVLVSTFVFGTFFCGWMCPFGFVQDMLIKIRNKFGIKAFRVPKKWHRFLVISRYVLWIVAFLGVVFLFQIDARISFLSLITGGTLSIFAYSALGIYVFLGLFIDRFFCTYVCNEGVYYSVRGVFRVFNVVRVPEKCIDCKKCDKICPMNVNVSGHVNVRSLQCVNCLKCVSVCPKKGAISYSFVDYKNLIYDYKKVVIDYKNLFKK